MELRRQNVNRFTIKIHIDREHFETPATGYLKVVLDYVPAVCIPPQLDQQRQRRRGINPRGVAHFLQRDNFLIGVGKA